MKSILFFFDHNGNVVRIIPDAKTTGTYDKIIYVYGYDQTIICKLEKETVNNHKFLTIPDGETIDIESLKTSEDVERTSFRLWEKAQNAVKLEKVKQAQINYEFYNSRHAKLLELIAYTEKQIKNVPYFSKQWETLQKRLITLENQLRQADAKREKAFSVIYN